jgi:polyhydroxyalkanoate synthesis repressor PhaR
MILIKRYPNRKLYNTQTKRYITLDGLATLIRAGEEIRVIENATGEDLTAVTLTQIILDRGKRRSGSLSEFPLAELIRAGGDHLHLLQRRLFSHRFWRQIDEDLHRRIQILIHRGELSIGDGESLFVKLVEAGRNLRQENYESGESDRFSLGKLEQFLRQHQLPSKDDIATLSAQLEQLEKQIDQIDQGGL